MKKMKTIDVKIRGEWQVLEYSHSIKGIYFVLDMAAIQRNCIKMKIWLRKLTRRNRPIEKITNLPSFHVLSQRHHNNRYIQVLVHKRASSRSRKHLIMKPVHTYTVEDSEARFFQELRGQTNNPALRLRERAIRMKQLI